jgi:hypothetical protein
MTTTHLKSSLMKRFVGKRSVYIVMAAPTAQDKVVPLGVVTQPPAAQLTDAPAPAPRPGGSVNGGFHLQAVTVFPAASSPGCTAAVSACAAPTASAAGSTDCVMTNCGATALAGSADATVSCGPAAACGSTVTAVCGSVTVSTVGGSVTMSGASATVLAEA